MHFEVNGQVYFLNFVPEQFRWFLFQPTRSGIHAIPVVTDETPLAMPAPVEFGGDNDIVN